MSVVDSCLQKSTEIDLRWTLFGHPARSPGGGPASAVRSRDSLPGVHPGLSDICVAFSQWRQSCRGKAIKARPSRFPLLAQGTSEGLSSGGGAPTPEASLGPLLARTAGRVETGKRAAMTAAPRRSVTPNKERASGWNEGTPAGRVAHVTQVHYRIDKRIPRLVMILADYLTGVYRG